MNLSDSIPRLLHKGGAIPWMRRVAPHAPAESCLRLELRDCLGAALRDNATTFERALTNSLALVWLRLASGRSELAAAFRTSTSVALLRHHIFCGIRSIPAP